MKILDWIRPWRWRQKPSPGNVIRARVYRAAENKWEDLGVIAEGKAVRLFPKFGEHKNES